MFLAAKALVQPPFAYAKQHSGPRYARLKASVHYIG